MRVIKRPSFHGTTHLHLHASRKGARYPHPHRKLASHPPILERPPSALSPNTPRHNAYRKSCHTRTSFSPSLLSLTSPQIPVLWLTTAPVGDDSASLHSPPPRQYNQLPELKFSFTSDNKITSRIINRASEVCPSISYLPVLDSSPLSSSCSRPPLDSRAVPLPFTSSSSPHLPQYKARGVSL